MSSECAQSAAVIELPKYNCYKQVSALRIKEIRQAPADQEAVNPGGDWILIPYEEGYPPVVVGHYNYYEKHRPEVGGYYVVYADGYKSYSPKQAFEEGYSLA